MNLGNLKKNAEEAFKKGKNVGKNLFAAVAIMAAVTSCGPWNKNTDNRIPQDPIKTEVVDKDSIKTPETPVKKAEQNTTEAVEFDENDLQMMEDIDASFAEDKKETERTIQTPREKFRISKETYENAMKAHKDAENNLIKLLKVEENFRDEDGLQKAKKIVDTYNRSRERLQLEIPPKAQKAINLYNQKKKELNK